MKLFDLVETKNTGKKLKIVGSEQSRNMEKKWQCKDESGYVSWYWDSQIQPRS